MLRTLIIFLLLPLFCDAQKVKDEGIKEYNEGNYSGAVKLFSHHLDDHPGDASGYLYRARAYNNLEEYDKALSDLNIYTYLEPTDMEALMERAILKYKLRHYELSIEDFHTLLRSSYSPGTTTTVMFKVSENSSQQPQIITVNGENAGLINYYLGSSYTHIDKLDTGLYFINQALRTDPDNVDYLTAKGLIYEKMELPLKAEQIYRDAIALNPDAKLIKYNLAVLLQSLGRFKEANLLLDEHIEEDDKNPYVNAGKAYQLFIEGDYENAVLYYTNALEQDPDNEYYLINRAKAFMRQHKYRAARTDLNKVLSIQPSHEQAYLNLGILEHKLKNYTTALRYYNIALIHYPEYGLAYLNRAILYYDIKRYDEACSDLQQAERYKQDISEKMSASICEKNNN